MKTINIFIIIGFIAIPFLVGAHGASNIEETQGSGMGMMRYIEESALENNELHEEMEVLMEKMMAGTMTEEEADKMTAFMRESPGPGAMMMGRMMGGGMVANKNIGAGGMMNGFGMFGSGLGGGIMVGYGISTILLWVFLILASIALWKWITTQK